MTSILTWEIDTWLIYKGGLWYRKAVKDKCGSVASSVVNILDGKQGWQSKWTNMNSDITFGLITQTSIHLKEGSFVTVSRCNGSAVGKISEWHHDI